jgi:hypothetical protein
MTLAGTGNAIGLAGENLARLGEAVLRDIPDAVIYADREGVVRFWNAGAARIFGFSQDERWASPSTSYSRAPPAAPLGRLPPHDGNRAVPAPVGRGPLSGCAHQNRTDCEDSESIADLIRQVCSQRRSLSQRP